MSIWTPKFRQGDTFTFQIIRKEVDDNGIERPIDITGYTYTFTLREDFDDEEFKLQVVTTPGDHPADDPVNGSAFVSTPSSLSSQIEAGKYVWDVEEKTPSGAVTTVLPEKENYKEKSVVYPEVTK